MGDLDRVRFGSKIVDRRTSEMLAEAQRLAQGEDPTIKDFRLTQGSFSSNVAASAGTHGGPGAFDMYTSAYTPEQKEIIGMALRTVGFASWRRRAIPGKWSEHWHGIAMDTEGLPPVAARQVKSYLNGRDGLAGNGKDPDARPDDINTWEEYKQERPELDQLPDAGQPAPVFDPFGIDSGASLDRDTDLDGLTDTFEKLAGTNLRSGDSDSDGLSDAYEAVQSHTDPLAADTDRDALSDAAELASGSDAGRLPGIAGVVGTGVFAESIRGGVKDADADGLSDHAEKLVGLDPKKADSDVDGLTDGTEAALGTDPLLADSDHDGLTDELEVEYGSDPLGSFVDSSGRMVKTAPWTLEAAYARLKAEEGHDHTEESHDHGEDTPGTTGSVAGSDPFAIDPGQAIGQASPLPGAEQLDLDTDRDGLTDAFEKLAGTKVTVADSDSDGLSDGYEALKSRTDPLSKDTDSDKLTDAQEIGTGGDAGRLPGVAGVVGTGALAENVRDGIKDADSDGLSDRAEKLVGTDAKKADTDHDKLSDAMEIAFGSNPLLADTDSDGISDSIEVQYGMDPLAPGSAMAPTVPIGQPVGGGLPADSPADAGDVFDPS